MRYLLLLMAATSVACSKGTITDENAALLGLLTENLVTDSAEDVGNPDNRFTGVTLRSTRQAAKMAEPIAQHFFPEALFSQKQAIADQRVIAFACPNVTGTTDADSDGIYAAGTISFTECSTVTGSMTVTDDNDADDQSGFDVDMNLSATSSGVTLSTTLELDANTTVTGGNIAAFAMDYAFTLGVTYNNQSASLTSNATIGYTPDTPYADINSAGTGSLSYSGSFTFAYDGKDISLSISTSNLLFTATGCSGEPGFTSGSVTLTDEDGNTVVATFSSCEASFTHNGSALSI